MSRLSNAVIAAAATLFVIASAAVNATFLSSLARTPLEGGVLLAISLAADTAKLVLPIAVMAALASRADFSPSGVKTVTDYIATDPAGAFDAARDAVVGYVPKLFANLMPW